MPLNSPRSPFHFNFTSSQQGELVKAIMFDLDRFYKNGKRKLKSHTSSGKEIYYPGHVTQKNNIQAGLVLNQSVLHKISRKRPKLAPVFVQNQDMKFALENFIKAEKVNFIEPEWRKRAIYGSMEEYSSSPVTPSSPFPSDSSSILTFLSHVSSFECFFCLTLFALQNGFLRIFY